MQRTEEILRAKRVRVLCQQVRPVNDMYAMPKWVQVRVFQLLDFTYRLPDSDIASPYVVIGSDILTLLRGGNPTGSVSLSTAYMEDVVPLAFRCRVMVSAARSERAYSFAGLLHYLMAISAIEKPAGVLAFIDYHVMPIIIRALNTHKPEPVVVYTKFELNAPCEADDDDDVKQEVKQEDVVQDVVVVKQEEVEEVEEEDSDDDMHVFLEVDTDTASSCDSSPFAEGEQTPIISKPSPMKHGGEDAMLFTEADRLDFVHRNRVDTQHHHAFASASPSPSPAYAWHS